MNPEVREGGREGKVEKERERKRERRGRGEGTEGVIDRFALA